MPSKRPETTWILIAGVVLALAVAGAVVALDRSVRPLRAPSVWRLFRDT